MTWFLKIEYIFVHVYAHHTLLYAKQKMVSFNLYLKADVIIDLVYHY